MRVKGYRVWCNESKRIITSRDVVFDENSMLVSSVEKPIDNVVMILLMHKRRFNLPILMKMKIVTSRKNSDRLKREDDLSKN